MATTTLEMHPEAVEAECHRRRVQELTDVITRHLPRFHRIALRHLGNVADAEESGRSVVRIETSESVQRTSEDVHVDHDNRD